MKAPDPEEWMEYLYQEARQSDRKRLEAELENDETARRKLEDYQRVRKSLDEWQVSEPRRRVRPRGRWIRQGIAALFLLGIGLWGGASFFTRQSDWAAMKEELRGELVREVAQEWAPVWEASLAGMKDEISREQAVIRKASQEETTAWIQLSLLDLAQVLKQERRQETKELMQAFNRLEQQRWLEHARLRRDLESVALHTETRFSVNEEQMGFLALASHPDLNPRQEEPSGRSENPSLNPRKSK